MGYSTEFKGELKFKEEMSASQLAEIKKFLDGESSDHPEWGNPNNYYVDLEFLDDFSGLKWNGAEKTHGMVEVVNMITANMRERLKYSGFGFYGELNAQGEDMDDRWNLVINDLGVAEKREAVIVGDRACCPECGHNFILG